MLDVGMLCAGLLCLTGGLIAWPIGVWLGWRSVARAAPGHCGACGYDRSGVDDSEVCPECGVGWAEAARRVAPGAGQGALIRAGVILVSAIAAFFAFTFGTSASSVMTIIASLATTAGFTGVCVWFLRNYVHAMHRPRFRGFMLMWSIAYLAMAAIVCAAAMSWSGTGLVSVVMSLSFAHVTALSFTGWVVLHNAAFKAGERAAGPLSM